MPAVGFGFGLVPAVGLGFRVISVGVRVSACRKRCGGVGVVAAVLVRAVHPVAAQLDSATPHGRGQGIQHLERVCVCVECVSVCV